MGRVGTPAAAVRAVTVPTFGAVSFAVLITCVVRTSVWLVPFVVVPSLAMVVAARSASRESANRRRSEQLLALSHLMAGSIDVEDLVTSFLALVRESFGSSTAFLVLESAGRAETVVVADERGVSVRLARPAERALLATTEIGGGVLDHVELPSGDGPGARLRSCRVLVAPLDAEGRRLGVVGLSTASPTVRSRSRVARGLDARDLTPLVPVASALAVALRAADHLASLVDETAKSTAVVEHSSDGIVVLDPDGGVVVWNPAMVELTNVPAGQAVGRPLRELVTIADAKGHLMDPLLAGWSRLSPEDPQCTYESTVLRPDGETRWVRWSHTAVFGAAPVDPPLVRDVVLVHDLTKARAVDRLKTDFIATVSHELRSPLTPIKGYVELLRRKGDEFTPAKRAECLDVIGDRVAHLARIVEDLLLASRVASPASSVLVGTGDLAALVRRSAGDFSVDAGRIRLEVPDRVVAVRCDPGRVVQVVSNLVSNALNYSAEPSIVVLRLVLDETPSVDAPAGMAFLSVIDSGRGIPANQLERVFDKFHRVEDAMRMTTSGTGLGLFIARQLTDAMGGTLTVDSTFGIGSTFTLQLQLGDPAELDRRPGPTSGGSRPPFPALPPRLPARL